MQTKGEVAAENREAASGLVPKLRFPGFGGKWQAKKLGGICDMQAGKFVPAAAIQEVRREDLYPCFGGNGLRGYTATYTNDGALPLIGRQGALCGNVTFATGKFHATEHAVVANPKPGIRVEWLYYALDLLKLNRFATGQAQPGLSVEVLNQVDCSKPLGEEEQRQIGDCLSSLDAFIHEEIRKLDALKAHKQGLMQQLFPAEGQCLPRLRFPGFEGGWRPGRLGEMAEFKKGKGIAKADISTNGAMPCIRYGELYTTYGEVITRVVSKTSVPTHELFVGKANDVLIPSSGETKEDIATAACVLNDGVAYGGDLIVIRTRLYGVFLSYFLNGMLRKSIARVAQGNSVVHLYPNQLAKIDLFVPCPEEQKRIASCLSSLDNLIAVQSRKIDALKEHKKGLMHGLFPVIEAHTP